MSSKNLNLNTTTTTLSRVDNINSIPGNSYPVHTLFNQEILDGYLFTLLLFTMYVLYPTWSYLKQRRNGVGREPGLPGNEEIIGNNIVQPLLSSFKDKLSDKVGDLEIILNQMIFKEISKSTELYQNYILNNDNLQITQILHLNDGNSVKLQDATKQDWSQVSGLERINKYFDLFTVDLTAKCQDTINDGECTIGFCIQEIQDTQYAKEFLKTVAINPGCSYKLFKFDSLSTFFN